MKILLSNDDGIHAPGMEALINALKDEHDLYIAAPSSQRSAYSHSVTYFYTVNKAYKREIEGVQSAWAIDGTPADCVYYGLNGLFDTQFDLIISGINNGRNMSSDCVYSGTVGAAGEGVLSKVPAIAVSLCGRDLQHYETAAEILKKVIPLYMADEHKLDYVLNLNVPDLPIEEVKGIKAAFFDEPVDYRRPITKTEIDENTLELSMEDYKPKKIEQIYLPEGDAGFVKDGYAAVSPLWFDMVRKDRMDNVRKMEMVF